MIEVRVSHVLGRTSAAARIREAAERMDVRPEEEEAPGQSSGSMRKDTPLGSVVATWEAHESEVVVQVVEKPVFLPEATVRRLLEDGLREALS